MEAMRESWTDERLDDFRERVDQRFDEMDKRFDRVEGQIVRIDARLDQGFSRIDTRLDSLGRAIIFGAIAFSSTVIAGFVAVATQL